jgi:hypothetical protein
MVGASEGLAVRETAEGRRGRRTARCSAAVLAHIPGWQHGDVRRDGRGFGRAAGLIFVTGSVLGITLLVPAPAAMASVLAAARPVLKAPDDPGARGLLGVVALILVIALVAAHLRLLRALARRAQDSAPPPAERER